jgi:hypothetical protein
MKTRTVYFDGIDIHIRRSDGCLYACEYGDLYSDELQEFLRDSATDSSRVTLRASFMPLLAQVALAEGITLVVKPISKKLTCGDVGWC